jgi:hypothetical protein
MTATAPKRSRKPRPDDETAARQLDHALLKAVYDADLDSTLAALDDGADVNAADPQTGLAALHIAIGTNNLTLTRILVEDWGAAIKPDGRGRWPTLIAAQCRVDEDLSDYVVEAEEKALDAE